MGRNQRPWEVRSVPLCPVVTVSQALRRGHAVSSMRHAEDTVPHDRGSRSEMMGSRSDPRKWL